MKKSLLLNFILLFVSIAANLTLYFLEQLNLISFAIGTIPLLFSLIVSILTEKAKKSRSDQIDALYNLQKLYRILIAAAEEAFSLNMRRNAYPNQSFHQINIKQQIEFIIEKNYPVVEAFIKAFGYRKKQKVITLEWVNNLDSLKELIERHKKLLNLSKLELQTFDKTN